MPEPPKFSPDEEERICQKREEFKKVIEEQKKLHPGSFLSINPGQDPYIAREAMTRLIEENIEQAITSHAGQVSDPDMLQRIKTQFRERADALFVSIPTT